MKTRGLLTNFDARNSSDRSRSKEESMSLTQSECFTILDLGYNNFSNPVHNNIYLDLN